MGLSDRQQDRRLFRGKAHRPAVSPVMGKPSMHGRLRAGPWSRQYAHAIGRGVAGCLFAVLVTCGSAPSAFESLAAPHRTVAMRDDTPIQDHVGEGLAFVKPVIPPVPIEDASEPFGPGAIPVALGEIPAKWRDVEGDIRGDMDILAHCRVRAQSCPPEARRFLAIVDEGRARDGRARIGVINRAINLAIQPMSDFAQWGVADHWSSPLETFLTGRGDCEDYAIAKYVALVEAGVAEQDVTLLLERDLTTHQDHAVVATRLNGDWIVLDNRWFALAQDVELRQIVPLRRLVPLFVLDHESAKQFASNKGDQNLGILAESLEVAPAAIPKISEHARLELVTEELSKRRSKDSSAFLDGLTNSVDSGNLLERRLTIADMRDYATRTYRSHAVDNSGD
jgi:predicted transglutaminase-like cysteine proteinase